MYEVHFNLNERPFPPVCAPDRFVAVPSVQGPLGSLLRCIRQNSGIVVLTAEAGAGKTTLCRQLIHDLKDWAQGLFLPAGRFSSRRAVLQSLLHELRKPFIGLSEQEARLSLIDVLCQAGPPVGGWVLIADEAHLLSDKILDELRSLAMLERDGRILVQLVLSGQLGLEETLALPAMHALNQRVGCHVCLEPLSPEESAIFVHTRIRQAGGDPSQIITPEAMNLIASAAEGNLRRIQQLADHSLLLAFAKDEHNVSPQTIREALIDLRELPLHWNEPLALEVRDGHVAAAIDPCGMVDHAGVSMDAQSEATEDLATCLQSAHEQHSLLPTQLENPATAAVFEVGAAWPVSNWDDAFAPRSVASDSALAVASAVESDYGHSLHSENRPLTAADAVDDLDLELITPDADEELDHMLNHFPEQILTAQTSDGFEEEVVVDAYAQMDRRRPNVCLIQTSTATNQMFAPPVRDADNNAQSPSLENYLVGLLDNIDQQVELAKGLSEQPQDLPSIGTIESTHMPQFIEFDFDVVDPTDEVSVAIESPVLASIVAAVQEAVRQPITMPCVETALAAPHVGYGSIPLSVEETGASSRFSELFTRLRRARLRAVEDAAREQSCPSMR